LKRYIDYDFEGTLVRVASEYDVHTGMYIDEYPDFEETPIYTPSGKPLVAAMQDQCSKAKPMSSDTDCGSCQFFTPNKTGDLIGICANEERKCLLHTDNTERKDTYET